MMPPPTPADPDKGRPIEQYDLVELIEDFETAPAGATGGVLELLDGDKAMVEFTSLSSEVYLLDRLLVVPLTKLRLAPSEA